MDNKAIILDVKYISPPSLLEHLGPRDLPWYSTLFAGEGARAVNAQHSLTSYSDPFLGWLNINGSSHVVRQRSPWKKGINIAKFSTTASFNEYVNQVAVITATSHTRGSVGHAPVQFKEVIASALGADEASEAWSNAVVRVAVAYREQVLRDFTCFKEWHDNNYTRTANRA